MAVLRLTMVVVQLLSHVLLFDTPWTAAHQASLSFTVSKSLLKLMSTLLLSHRSHHGSHALSWEGPVPVGSALLPQRPHLAEAHF